MEKKKSRTRKIPVICKTFMSATFLHATFSAFKGQRPYSNCHA